MPGILIYPDIFIAVSYCRCRLWKVGKTVCLQFFKIRCNLCKLFIFSATGAIVIQQAKVILFFSSQHTAPGPRQDYLRAVQQTKERIHSKQPFRPLIAAKISCLKFQTPHGFPQLCQSVLHIHQYCHQCIFILRIQIRIKAKSRKIHPFFTLFQIIISLLLPTIIKSTKNMTDADRNNPSKRDENRKTWKALYGNLPG